MTEYYMTIRTGCQWGLLNIFIFQKKVCLFKKIC